jgi:DNA mismatch repair protein MutL
MGKIRVLPDQLASQVAAGEVVERPESVLRELADNALDAGARRVEIRIEAGGRAAIAVADDGCGMARDDALLSLERHATSKLQRLDQLAAITTLGFRGEALPSIASVSKFRLRTREQGALAGTCIEVEGGILRDVREDGCAPGTQVEVRDLFYNVPARRKFLRTDATEFGHIDQRVRLLAAAHPGVAFTLWHNGRESLRLPAGPDARPRVNLLVGADAARRLLAIGENADDEAGFRATAYLSPPGWSRPSGGMVWFFVNGRPVVSTVLRNALADAYHGLIDRHGHPACVVFLTLPPESFDINVHPAKREIRFRDSGRLRSGLARLLRNALVPTPAPRPATPPPTTPPPLPPRHADCRRRLSDSSDSSDPRPPARPPTPPPPPPPRPRMPAPAPVEDATLFPGEAPAAAPDPLAAARHLGTLHGSYELFESGEGLVVMERRAAIERILFEWLGSRRGQAQASQSLLLPVPLDLDPAEWEELEPHLPALRELGFQAEPFGPRALLVTALPAAVRADDPAALVRLVFDATRAAAQGRRGPLETRALLVLVSRELAAGGRALPEFGAAPALLRRLLACEMPYCCPRGRPTLVQFGHAELARRFGLDAGRIG